MRVMMAKTKAIEVDAELRQIKSMVDHTYNLTLNIPEYCIDQIKPLMDKLGDTVKIIVFPDGDV
jgi:hypothetical protein